MGRQHTLQAAGSRGDQTAVELQLLPGHSGATSTARTHCKNHDDTNHAALLGLSEQGQAYALIARSLKQEGW